MFMQSTVIGLRDPLQSHIPLLQLVSGKPASQST